MEEIHRGLDGVVVDTTAIAKVMPEINSLVYRGYPAQELAENCCFEEVAYLIWNGELPKKVELEEFRAREKTYRSISEGMLSLIKSFPKGVHPMDGLRTCVSFLGIEEKDDAPVKLLAKIPTMIAAIQRHKEGREFVAPSLNLDFAQNFLYMCSGTVPEKKIASAFDVALTLYAEHGFNASTFSARVVTSTESDIYSAVVGAIGTLKGGLHGGANIEVANDIKKIKTPEEARNFILHRLANREKVAGFGHRVYRNGDSRVPTLKKYLNEIARMKGRGELLQIYDAMEQTMREEKNIFPNVDFPVGFLYEIMGLDESMYVSIFAMARIVGWCAHILEQQKNNRLIRPLSEYIGKDARRVIPLRDRI